MSRTSTIVEATFEAVADTDARGGLGEHAAGAEPANFLRHAAALSLTKTADGLIDPKLVLSWLLTQLSVSSFWIGLLVPVREAGALLPQMLTAPWIEAMERRKWAWTFGSLVQGLAAAGIAVAGLTLEGRAAGIVIVSLLAVLALARSICSVSYKDILGKTVGRTRRGTATGLAGSVSSAAVAVFAVVLMTGLADRFVLVTGAICLAAAFWVLAATIFASLDEARSRDVTRPDSTLGAALSAFSVLKDDAALRRFILARGLLTGTALAPPFLVILASEAGGSALSQLGALVLASSAAAFLSSYVWGRLADRSSRRVLMLAGVAAAVALIAAVAAALTGLAGAPFVLPAILFALMIAYNGVRQGRSTYLVDMAPEDARARYAAVSNTVIGVVLLASGLFGALASVAGAVWTIALFAVMSVAGAIAAWSMPEAQDRTA